MNDAATLDQVLERLWTLNCRPGMEVAAGDGASDWYEVMLFPAATTEEIQTARLLVGKPIPAEFLQFWRFTNGANLFVNDSGLHGVGVASTHLLLQLQQEEAEVYGEKALEPYLVFARVNGSGDFLVFELATGRVLDGIHAEQPREWRAIAGSFTEWLRAFIDAEGRYHWIEALYEPARLEG